MVRVPGSVGDSISPSADQQSTRRNSVDGREGDLDPDPDLEDKPLPPQVPTRTAADLDVSRDPSTKQGKAKAEPYRLVGSPVEPSPYPPRDLPVSRSDKKKPTKKLTWKKMKAPEIDDEDQIGSKPRSRSGQGWLDEDLENLFYHKELREFLDRDPVMRIPRLKQVGYP
ncbi:Hypothetical protein PHPALM_14233 [Phytophthora palmivora]|uniref:Uncharacterized protein n=1 Tax=Phytophthora palmivora TaxID=4796 RepID=A0A2P4XV84_9STRA|nr:Hypothetical protein PHPALM_14233 [Phytophthora palmivora]